MGKECKINELIYKGNQNQEFSYSNTKYFVLNWFSLAHNKSPYLLQSWDKKSMSDINAVSDYLLKNNDKMSNNENSVRKLSYQDKRHIAEGIVDSLEQNKLIESYNRYISTYQNRIETLKNIKTDIVFKDIDAMIEHAKSTSATIFNEYNEEVAKLDEMDDNLIVNVMLKKLSEIVLDNIFSIFSPSVPTGNNTIRILRTFTSFFRGLPWIGLIMIAFDIALIIWDIIKSKQAYQLAKEYALLKCFYTNIDNQASSIIFNNEFSRDDYYKIESNNRYFLGLYNYKRYTDISKDIFGKELTADIFYSILEIDELCYNDRVVDMPNVNYMKIKSKEESFFLHNIAQLSLFYPSQDINFSSYFHHIKRLLLESSFLFIQTSTYSSMLINAMLSSSYKKDDKLINPDKYTIIITNSHDINHFQYKSQQNCYSNIIDNKLNNNILAFYTSYKMNMDLFISQYNARIYEFVDTILNMYYDLKIKDYEDINEKFTDVSELIIDNIFGYSSNISSFLIFTQSKSEFKNNLYQTIVNNFIIYNKKPILEKLANVVTRYQQKYDNCLKDDKFGSAFDEIYDYGNSGFSQKYRTYLKKICDFFYFMHDISLLVSNYYVPVKDSELKQHIKEYQEEQFKFIDSFFTVSEKETSAITAFIKQDNNIKNICKKIYEVEYSLDFKSEQQKAKAYINQILIDENSKKFKKYIDDFKNILKNTKLYINMKNTGFNTLQETTIDNFCDNMLSKLLFYMIESKLPVKKSQIERIYGDIHYFDKIYEYVYANYLDKKDANGFLFSCSLKLLIDKIQVDVVEFINDIDMDLNIQNFSYQDANDLYKVSEELVQHLKNNYLIVVNHYAERLAQYLLLFFLICNCGFSDDPDSDLDADLNTEYNNINKEFQIEEEKEDSIFKFIFDYLVEKIQEKIDISNVLSLDNSLEKFKDNSVMAANLFILYCNVNQVNNKIKDIFVIIRSSFKFIDLNSLPAFLWNNRHNIGRRSMVSLLKMSFHESLNEGFETDAKLYDTYKNIKAQAQRAGNFAQYMIQKAQIKYGYSDDLSNTQYDRIIYTKVRQYLAKKYGISPDNIRYVKKFKGGMHWKFIANGHEYTIDHANNYDEFKKILNDVALDNYNDSVKDLPKFSQVFKNIKKRDIFKFTASLASECFIDYAFPILDKDEYERNKAAVEFAYLHQRTNVLGSIWNEEKRFFTIPKNISQNYIMADFTAMVVGGAHFDNSCFISTPSSGIFVQNESVVTKSYVQLILDTLYKINKTDIDKKMGKYIIAYYNIVNYLYQITLDYQALHPSIHGYITSINSYMHSQGYDFNNKFVIDEQNKSKSEYNINNKMYKQLDTMTKKDFVIQLKRFGESNYKFYHTQEEPQNGKQSKNKHSSYGDNEFCEYNNKEIPLLLGSLIYDEQWFKSTIDSAN